MGGDNVSYSQIREDIGWKEQVKKSMLDAKEKLKSQKLRPLGAFFGLGEPKPFDTFAVKGGAGMVKSRLRRNGAFFFANYMAVLIGAIVISILTSPTALLCMAAIIGGWWYTLKASDSADIQLGKFKLSRNMAAIIMGFVTAVVGLYLLTTTSSWTFWLCMVIVIAHAITRNDENSVAPEVASSGMEAEEMGSQDQSNFSSGWNFGN